MFAEGFVLGQHMVSSHLLTLLWKFSITHLNHQFFFCPLLKKWIKAVRIEITTIFRLKRTSSPCCQNPLLHFYIFIFHFLRHQLAPQSDFCVWHAWGVNYKNSGFKASFALFCGKKFPLSGSNCSDARDNSLRCVRIAFVQTVKVILENVWVEVSLVSSQKEEINIERAPSRYQTPHLPSVI